MNKLMIIGNLTHDPVLRTVRDGISVCDFSVAVNRRNNRQSTANGQPEVDYFRVTAWRQLGEICAKYLAKGRKVCVVGAVSVRTYQANDGTTRASLEVQADDVEFLSSRMDDGAPAYNNAAPSAAAAPALTAQNNGFTAVETDELPF